MENSIPWIEKYRPATIEEVILDKNISNQINIFMEDRKNVHLIITGQPGIGKTSTVRCIAKKILGENKTDGYLELNAAEDRGTKSTEKNIAPFCKKIVNFKTSKIILFDEADNMTSKCQYDINDMIKKYGSNTKFIFTCNDSTKIIEDIQSVCRIIRYKKLTDDQISSYLANICQKEKIKFNEPGLRTICYISGGDMRKAINDLQKTAYTFNSVTKKTVLTICKIPDPEEIKKIINLCIKQDIVQVNNEIENIIRQGYYYLDIISSFVYVLSNFDMDENKKLALIETVSVTKIAVSIGIRSKLQLSAMMARIIKICSENK